MTTRPLTVEVAVAMRLVAPGAAALPVRADLRYDVLDPYAVEVCFHTRSGATSETVQWTFGRALLTGGLDMATGEGDVQVWPSTTAGAPVVCLSLSSPSGRALFEMPREQLDGFLQRCRAAVPDGTESQHVDVDAELALLLWTAPDN